MEPSFLCLQAESSKKMLSSKEELQFNISELSGMIVKQGFLVKQVNTVFEPSLWSKKNDSSYGCRESEWELHRHGWGVVHSRLKLPINMVIRDHEVKSVWL